MGICKESVFYTPARFGKKQLPVSRPAILLALAVLFLAVSSVNAQLSIGVNQKGLDCGVGVLDSGRIDCVLKGNFSYFSADSFSRAWAVSGSLIIGYRFFHTQGFKIYVATGPYVKYASYSAAYMSFGQFTDVNDPRREVLLGWNVLALRPEAIINKRVSAYAHIPLVLYQFGTQAGNKNLLINFISSDALGMNDGMPEIGIRFYF